MSRVWPLLALVVLLGGQPNSASAQLQVKEKSSVEVDKSVSFTDLSMFTPDGTALVGFRNEVQVVLVDVATGKEKIKFQASSDQFPLTCLAVSSDSTMLATGSKVGAIGGAIKVWDLKTRKQLVVLRDGRPQSYPRAVAFHPDGKTLASVSEKAPVGLYSDALLWDLGTGKQRAELDSWGDSFHKLAFSSNGKVLIAQKSGGSSIFVWDMETEERSRRFNPPDSFASTAFVISPDSKLLATADRKNQLWDMETGKEKGSPLPDGGLIAFCADSKLLALSAGKGVQLVAVDTGKILATLEGARPPLHFSKDGKTLITLGGKGLTTWELIWEKEPPK